MVGMKTGTMETGFLGGKGVGIGRLQLGSPDNVGLVLYSLSF